MNKHDFLTALRERLSGLPQEDIEERLSFYCEMIDDRIEEGLSEEAAVSELGSIDAIIDQIIADIPLSKLAKEKIKTKRKLRPWEIVLLAVGSPIWVSLLIAAFAVIISLYVALWSVIISFWAAFGSTVACSVGGIISGIIFLCTENGYVGFAMFGASLICAGLSIFMFFGCNAATKGTLLLAKKIILFIKRCFVGKENS